MESKKGKNKRKLPAAKESEHNDQEESKVSKVIEEVKQTQPEENKSE